MITSLMALGMILGLIFVLWIAARDGAKVNEQLAQSKREREILKKQIEVANEQTEIANNAPVDRADAIRRLRFLRQRHISNR